MRKWMIVSLFSFIILLIIGCDIDHGIEPLNGRLEAKIIFSGKPPENTEGIYLTVAPIFPPHAINEMFHSPNSIPLNQDTVEASLDLPYGHYEALIIWWYSKETKSNLADILSIVPDNYGKPQSFDLTKESPVFRFNKLKLTPAILDRPSTLKGKITFNGPFPSNTWVTTVVAYWHEPVKDVDYLTLLKSIDFSVGPSSDNFDPATNTYTYTLPVQNSVPIGYIAVFWLPEQAGITDFRVLGTYDFSSIPGKEFNFREATVMDSLDIQADWSQAH